MNEAEELFAKYYNQGKIMIADMDDTQLREHRELLRQVATEAKAKLMAADDEIRERGAKKKTKDKEWLVTTDTSQSTSDAINAVKQRAARMSKMDKLKKSLEDAGLDDKTVKEMIANLERKATEKNIKTITFNKPSTEPVVVQVENSQEEKKDFDWGSLGIK